MEQKEVIAELENMTSKRSILSSKMNALLNISSGESVEVMDDIGLVVLNESDFNEMDSVFAKNPSILMLSEKMKAIELKEDVIRNSGKPSITAGIGYSAISERTDMDVPLNGQDIIMPMLSFQLPIYRKKYDAGFREIEFMLRQTAFEIDNKKNQLSSVMVETKSQYEQANRNVVLYEELLVQAREALEILQSSYSSANTGYVEVLRMQRMILMHEMKLENAKTDQNISVAKLEKLMAEGL